MYHDCQERLTLEDSGFYLKLENGEKIECYGLLYVRVAIPRKNNLKSIPFLHTKLGNKNYVRRPINNSFAKCLLLFHFSLRNASPA